MSTEHDSNFESLYHKGNNLYFDKQYDEAIVIFTHIIESNPNYKWAYDRRGSAYKSLEQYDHALADYNRALEIDPSFDNAYRNRAHVYRKNGFPRAAIADFERAKQYSKDTRTHAFIDEIIAKLKADLE